MYILRIREAGLATVHLMGLVISENHLLKLKLHEYYFDTSPIDYSLL